MIRDSIFLAGLLTAACACGLIAARLSSGFLRWAINRTLFSDW